MLVPVVRPSRMLSQATDPESVPADQAALFDGVHALAEAVGREGRSCWSSRTSTGPTSPPAT